MSKLIVDQLLAELNAEVAASRNCVTAIPESAYGWKPHERSMLMGYLVLLVAEIPLWIHTMIEVGEIDFATYEHFEAKNTGEMVAHFEENIKKAQNSLAKLTDEELIKTFNLKANGILLMTDKLGPSLSSTLNHWVHHRGQLTVYMRLKDIPVPSIYGPSADDKSF